MTTSGLAASVVVAGPSRAARWVIAGCAAAMVYVALTYLVVVAGVPRYLQRVAEGQVPTLLIGGNGDVSNAIVAAEAASRGLSLEAYAAYNLALNGLIALGFWTAAALVLWRRGDDWYRWLTALLLFFFPSGTLSQISLIAFPAARAWLDAGSLLWPLFQVFLYLFPDGRLPGRAWRWPMAVTVGVHALFQVLAYSLVLTGARLETPGLLAFFGLNLALAFVFIAAGQVSRYRRAGPVARKQLQWFVVGIVLLAAGSVLNVIVEQAWPALYNSGYYTDLDSAMGLVLPAAITIAILRYRLWDIDVLVRRTLIYSVLSAVLALAYLGSVLVLESVFRALTGQGQNSLVVVLSTLAIAALFGPVRARVQATIDKRFFRKKYDAARTLAVFAASARDETDLARLNERLVSVVNETMQPASVGLWLRGREKGGPMTTGPRMASRGPDGKVA